MILQLYSLSMKLNMPSCVIPTCKHATGRSDNKEISFHRFPSDNETRDKWINIVRKSRLQKNWNPRVQSVICSAHFNESDIYETQNSLKRIKKGAVPSQNIATEVVELCDDTSDEEYDKSLAQIQPGTASDTEFNDVDITSSEYIFDTPTERSLRFQIYSRIKNINKYKCKIRLLKEKNAEVEKKSKELKESIINYVINSLTE